ncbi:hypothetical protein FB107DRAFT_279370 [Schizophyllum commune]
MADINNPLGKPKEQGERPLTKVVIGAATGHDTTPRRTCTSVSTPPYAHPTTDKTIQQMLTPWMEKAGANVPCQTHITRVEGTQGGPLIVYINNRDELESDVLQWAIDRRAITKKIGLEGAPAHWHEWLHREASPQEVRQREYQDLHVELFPPFNLARVLAVKASFRSRYLCIVNEDPELIVLELIGAGPEERAVKTEGGALDLRLS